MNSVSQLGYHRNTLQGDEMGLQSLFKRRPIVTIRQTLIALPFLLVALLGLIRPYETIVVPEWRLSVLNLEGQPEPDVLVRQSWGHYSLEPEPYHELQARTNSQGIVTFPAHNIKACVALRLFGAVRSFVKTGIHASYGPHSWVIAFKDGHTGSLDYQRGKPLGRTLVINRDARE